MTQTNIVSLYKLCQGRHQPPLLLCAKQASRPVPGAAGIALPQCNSQQRFASCSQNMVAAVCLSPSLSSALHPSPPWGLLCRHATRVQCTCYVPNKLRHTTCRAARKRPSCLRQQLTRLCASCCCTSCSCAASSSSTLCICWCSRHCCFSAASNAPACSCLVRATSTDCTGCRADAMPPDWPPPAAVICE